MKSSTIKTVLHKKLLDWVSSFDNSKLSEEVLNNIIVAGGCIPSLLTGDKVNDFDIYFTNKDTALKVAKFYIEKYIPEDLSDITAIGLSDRIKLGGTTLKNNGIIRLSNNIDEETDESFSELSDQQLAEVHKLLKISSKENYEQKYRLKFITENAISLSDKIQLVLRFIGSPEELFENFDFVHCTNCYIPSCRELVLNKDALESILTKTLVYVGSKFPVCSYFRTKKFIKRGWNISAGQQLKIIFQINELNLKDINTLREQLIGVDYLYFKELLYAIEKCRKNDENINLDFDLITKILDQIE